MVDRIRARLARGLHGPRFRSEQRFGKSVLCEGLEFEEVNSALQQISGNGPEGRLNKPPVACQDDARAGNAPAAAVT